MSRPRWCATHGCYARAVTTVPAVGIVFGRVSACAACWRAVTGREWPGGTEPQGPVVTSPPPARRPPSAPLPGPVQRLPSGRRVAASDVRRTDGQPTPADRRTGGAVTTRLLWWLCEATPEGRYWRVDAAAVLEVEPEQVDVAYRYLRRAGWVAGDRSVTEAGRSEASRRRDVQARVAGEGVKRG